MDFLSRLFIFFPMREKRSSQMYSPETFPSYSGIKISNVVTKETSQILLQTLALTETANKFSQSVLRGLIHRYRI